jgi:MFS family permease
LEWARNIYDPTTLPWRLCFAVGLIPSIVVFFIFAWLKEPESWKAAQEQRKKGLAPKAGSIFDLFKKDTIRATTVGVTLASIGMATFWVIFIYGKDVMLTAAQHEMVVKQQIVEGYILEGELIGEETEYQIVGNVAFENKQILQLFPNDEERIEEIRRVVRKEIKGETRYFGVTDEQDALLKRWEMLGFALASIGMFLGQLCFGPLAQRVGRKNAFVVFHLGGFFITIFLFQFYMEPWLLCILLPLFGFLTTGMYAGYAVYFPELFPTRLRGTGTGFCFNGGRLVACPVLLIQGWMITHLGLTLFVTTTILSALYLLGPLVILFARETKGQELME